MIQVNYNSCHEVAEMAGTSVYDVRLEFRARLGIPDKARAYLNGICVKGRMEAGTVLNDDDVLTFRTASMRNLVLLTALLAAIAVTGGVFAFTYTTSSSTLNVVAPSGGGGGFVEVTVNATSPIGWTVYGSSSSATGNGTLWDISTVASGYTGDIVGSIYLTNISDISNTYRAIGLTIIVKDSSGNLVDINNDGAVNSKDEAFLSMKNATVDLFIAGAVDTFTVYVKNGFYVSNPYDAAWTSDTIMPKLFLDVVQGG